MRTYKLICAIAIVAVLGAACKKEDVKIETPELKNETPEVKTFKVKSDQKHPCGTYWYDNHGNGHIAAC